MQVADDVKEKFKDTTEALSNGLKEVRSLSKTLNNDVILNIGFEKSITNELDRMKKMKFTSAELKIIGDKADFNDRKHEIIIFRILQEFLSNSVKYSEAKNIGITLDYKPKSIIITATDDGKGFDINEIEQGSGLINMKSRAALIGADLDLSSKLGEGVKLELNYALV